MTAYFVLTHTLTDIDRYVSEYIPGVMPILAKHGGEMIVGDFFATPLQGSPASGVAVIRFPSEDAITEFLKDPHYQPIKEIRLAVTEDANAVMAPEFAITS